MTRAARAIETYSDVDHAVWAQLLDSYVARLAQYGCKEAIAGFEKLAFRSRVESIRELSDRVHDLCGWRLRAVDGLIPEREFFRLLGEKVYPMAVQMRRPEELEFSELPDLFHDALGHLPLLIHPYHTEFLTRYCEAVTRYIGSERIVQAFGRLYWCTIETGLVMEDGCPKIFGAAILTSHAECKNAMSEGTCKLAFDLDAIFNSDYSSFKLQPRYFVIESFERLLSIAQDLGTCAGRLYETDARSRQPE